MKLLPDHYTLVRYGLFRWGWRLDAPGAPKRFGYLGKTRDFTPLGAILSAREHDIIVRETVDDDDEQD